VIFKNVLLDKKVNNELTSIHLESRRCDKAKEIADKAAASKQVAIDKGYNKIKMNLICSCSQGIKRNHEDEFKVC
jgi:hypothetical protein